MLFDINNYDVTLLFVSFALVFILLYCYFKNKITSFIDPFVMHLLWLSGNLAFIIGYTEKYGISLIAIFFLFIFLVYIFNLNKLLHKKSYRFEHTSNIKTLYLRNENKIKILYIITTILYFYSQKPFLSYAYNHNLISDWFLYRFVDLQGRDPFYRILSTGSSVYFVYFSLIMISFIKKSRLITIGILIISLLIGILSGGRSTLLSAAFSFGFFVYFHYGAFNGKIIKKINILGIILILVGLFFAMVVSSYYSEDTGLQEGIKIILNRVIATSDGLEYYLNYNGMENIKSGFFEYFMSVFGIYSKHFIDIQYKNIGQQLAELAVGSNLDFAQGPNYTIALQNMVFGYYFSPIYILVITFLVAKLRELKSYRINKITLYYFLSSTSFILAVDIEFWFFTLISGILFYLFIVYPLLKLKVRHA